MSFCFIGDSHAAQHLSRAAAEKGLTLCDAFESDLIFVSEDTPTNEYGVRDLDAIRKLVEGAAGFGRPIVLTSAVPPGFTRSLGIANIWHQAETLRMRDAEERAANPEMIVVGCPDGVPMPRAYRHYLFAFRCPVHELTWEEAEFSKLAINCTLAAQVDNTNRLSKAAAQVGANWATVAAVLGNDRRIGQHSYLEPGRWHDSRHLLRDMRTLSEIEVKKC